MIPKQAIEEAIEGGWIPTKGGFQFKRFTITTALAYKISMGSDCIALDPTFWQALFKDKAWRDGLWLPYAEDFLHLILTGGDTEKFWNELLN